MQTNLSSAETNGVAGSTGKPSTPPSNGSTGKFLRVSK